MAILSLRAGPQVLPASSALLAAVVGIDLLLSTAILSTGLSPGRALLIVAASLGLSLVFSVVALYLRNLLNRFLQTAIALLGTDILITLVAMPLSLLVTRQLGAAGDGSLTPNLAFGLLVVTAWLLAVVGGIFRHALDLPWLAALPIGLAYVIVTASISL